MEERIIDCCSLLNLYTGWGGLKELGEVRGNWYICQAALAEAQYARDFDSGGNIVEVPLDLSASVNSGLLAVASPASSEEAADFVNFAIEIDDGEAQALAVAKHRGYTLLTDDRKAIQIAKRESVNVRTISTVEILQSWAEARRVERSIVRHVLQRILTLARFSPHHSTEGYDWWNGIAA